MTIKKTGDHQGDPVPGFPCPWCGGLIVYNGNYFCNDYDRGCDWAQPSFDPIKEPREYAHEVELENLLYGLMMEWRKSQGVL